jgi:chorismate synthase
MIAEIDGAKAERDTLGGIVEILAYGLPPGIGGYTTAREKLDGRLAGAALSVQAMKGIEFGDGFAVAAVPGSQAHDQMHPLAEGQGMGVTRPTNHAGGIEGGMTNGAPILMRVAMKPLPTLMRPLDSVDLATGQPTKAHAERSDVCAVPAAAIVLEAAIAFELAAVIRMQFGSQAMVDVVDGMQAYRDRVRAVTR